MTPEEILARLKATFPHLNWVVQSRPQSEEYFGRFQDAGIPTSIFSITRWIGDDGKPVSRVELFIVGKSSPHSFRTIEEVLDWLEWFQEAVAKF